MAQQLFVNRLPLTSRTMLTLLNTAQTHMCGSGMQPQGKSFYENCFQFVKEHKNKSLSLDSGIESSSVDSNSRSSGNPNLNSWPEHYKVPRKIPPHTVSKSQEDDLQIVSKNVLKLKESGCYYPNMPQEEARRILKGHPEGYFLIRNSSSPSYLFSLTVRTTRGPTSIRIKYYNGLFRLDSTTKHDLPSFDSVMDLLEYYMGLSRPVSQHGMCASIILDASGKKTAVKLSQPYIKQPSSLKHICRKTVFRHLTSPDSVTSLPLSDSCKQYLKEYTHKV